MTFTEALLCARVHAGHTISFVTALRRCLLPVCQRILVSHLPPLLPQGLSCWLYRGLCRSEALGVLEGLKALKMSA